MIYYDVKYKQGGMYVRITKLRLENVAGLYVGSGLSEIEIDFSKSKNKITLIQSQNGRGKSVLISTLNPFSYIYIGNVVTIGYYYFPVFGCHHF